MAWRGQGAPVPPGGVATSVFGLYLRVGKIGTSGFVSSNSDNISFGKNLEYKNSRK
jgi:hypothetical protein